MIGGNIVASFLVFYLEKKNPCWKYLKILACVVTLNKAYSESNTLFLM